MRDGPTEAARQRWARGEGRRVRSAGVHAKPRSSAGTRSGPELNRAPAAYLAKSRGAVWVLRLVPQPTHGAVPSAYRGPTPGDWKVIFWRNGQAGRRCPHAGAAGPATRTIKDSECRTGHSEWNKGRYGLFLKTAVPAPTKPRGLPALSHFSSGKFHPTPPPTNTNLETILDESPQSMTGHAF